MVKSTSENVAQNNNGSGFWFFVAGKIRAATDWQLEATFEEGFWQNRKYPATCAA
jgi:hypothetical protein